jgi:hypothetical protein
MFENLSFEAIGLLMTFKQRPESRTMTFAELEALHPDGKDCVVKAVHELISNHWVSYSGSEFTVLR